MNTIQKGITTLLRSAITEERLSLPEDFCLEQAREMIRSHGIAALVYQGALNCGLDRKEPAMQQLFQSYCRLMLQSEGQLRELKRIFAAFEEAGIDYLPLKGSKMKMLYPKPELRSMGDADILIREKEYEKQIRPVMEKLGFAFTVESDHECVWDSKALHLELHKRLIPSYDEKFCDYFRDGWALAQEQEGHRYGLNCETEFLFLFTHFAKHYRGGGIGCRHVVDLWVYRRMHPELEEQTLRRELETLGLLEFYGNLSRLMDVWFEDGAEDEKMELLTNFIFSNGSWGSLAQHRLSSGLQKQKTTGFAGESRVRYVLQVMFPSMSTMTGMYPILLRFPWLLPWTWIWRLLSRLLGGGANWKQHRETLALYTQENLDHHRQMLEYVGLRDPF